MNIAAQRANTDLTAIIRQHCEDYHYLRRWPDARSLPFGYALEVEGSLYAADGRLHGLVVMKKPQHHRQRGLFGYINLPTSWQVLDLARVWIHPSLQRKKLENGHSYCVFSQFVSRVLKRVQWDWLDHHPPRFPDQPYHIEVVISYCDREHHDGRAYRASGFKWNGYSENQTKEVYYRLLNPPLKQWKPNMTTVQLPLFAGIPIYDGRNK